MKSFLCPPHPEDAVQRFELLSEVERDAFRRAHPDGFVTATDAQQVLQQAFEARRAQIADVAREALEGAIRERELPAIFICSRCGGHVLGFARRRWDVDRAMRRSGLSERDVLAVAFLLADAWAELGELPPKLDALDDDQLAAVLALDGTDARTIRAQITARNASAS